MENTQPPKATDKNFKTFTVASIVVLAAAVAWLAYRVENPPAVQTTTSKASTNNQPTDQTTTTVTSGKGGFSVALPNGWGPITKALDADYLILPGTKQPEISSNKPAQVIEAKGFGSDNASLFSIQLMDASPTAPKPRGQAAAFTIGKGETALAGTKYTYSYTKDEEVGVGYLRLAGDRDYEYVFPAKGKELHVWYSVYGSDPRNFIPTVDEIVHSIQVK